MTTTPIDPAPTADEVRWVAVNGSPRARVGAYLADVIVMPGDTIGENLGSRYGIRPFDPHDDSLSYEQDAYLSGLCAGASIVSDPHAGRADEQCLAAFWAEIVLHRATQ